MSPQDIVVTALVAAGCLALGGVIGAGLVRRSQNQALRRTLGIGAAAEVFETALLQIDQGEITVIAGSETLEACAGALDLTSANPQAILAAAADHDPAHARRLEGLMARGEDCAFEVNGPNGGVSVTGRTTGALVWLRLSRIPVQTPGLPRAERLREADDTLNNDGDLASLHTQVLALHRSYTALGAGGD